MHLSEPTWLLVTALLLSSSVIFFLLLSLRQNNRMLKNIGKLALSFNPSTFLGILAFSQTKAIKEDFYEMVMNICLTVSLIVYFSWAVTKHSMKYSPPPEIMYLHEVSALAGISTAALCTGDSNLFGFICSILFIGMTIFSFHRQNIMMVILIPMFVILNMKTILHSTNLINKEALVVYSLILISESLVNISCTSSTCIDRWKPVFGKYASLISGYWLDFNTNKLAV